MDRYQQRRQKLAKKLADNSVLLLPAAALQFRNSDAERPYRQHSDFYYLSGVKEYDSLIVITKQNGKATSMLFSQVKDKQTEIWTGPRIGQQQAVEKYLFDEAYAYEECEERIIRLLQNQEVIYCPLDDEEFVSEVVAWMAAAKQQSREANVLQPQLTEINPLIHSMRLFKETDEINIMREVAEVSAEAHRHLMQVCKPDMNEAKLNAEFQYFCAKRGCTELAYPAIVGGGVNACILHYTANDQILKDGDLVLIDAGAEKGYYAADITRTFPVNGKFSEEQAIIYNLVLEAQLAGIEQVRPENHWHKIQQVMVEILVDGLLKLGLMSGDKEKIIQDKSYREFYMHNSGHWLGLDVHDVGGYKVDNQWRQFKPGMALTIEPGIYIDPNNKNIPEKWRGIGVRIEDDIVVTDHGCEVMTSAVPKTIDEIETLMHGR